MWLYYVAVHFHPCWREVVPLLEQNGDLAKVDSGFDYAANFSSVACVA